MCNAGFGVSFCDNVVILRNIHCVCVRGYVRAYVLAYVLELITFILVVYGHVLVPKPNRSELFGCHC